MQEEIAKAAGLTAYPSLVQLIFQYDGSLWYDMLTAGEKKAIRDAAEQLSLAHYIEHRLIRSDPYVGSQPPQIGGECMLLEFFLGTNVGELGQEQMQLHGRPTTVFALNCWHLWQYATIAVHDCE